MSIAAQQIHSSQADRRLIDGKHFHNVIEVGEPVAVSVSGLRSVWLRSFSA